MTRLLDDSRREQMVTLHYSHFIPYRFFTNCQYFFSQNSVVPDLRNYQYGALSTLAVTPNICLGEIRPWLDDLSERDEKKVIAFYDKWTKFLKNNFRSGNTRITSAAIPARARSKSTATPRRITDTFLSSIRTTGAGKSIFRWTRASALPVAASVKWRNCILGNG